MDAAEALKMTKIKVNEAETSLQVVLWFAFPPQAPICTQQSMEELLANTAILAGTQGLLLSPQPPASTGKSIPSC